MAEYGKYCILKNNIEHNLSTYPSEESISISVFKFKTTSFEKCTSPWRNSHRTGDHFCCVLQSGRTRLMALLSPPPPPPPPPFPPPLSCRISWGMIFVEDAGWSIRIPLPHSQDVFEIMGTQTVPTYCLPVRSSWVCKSADVCWIQTRIWFGWGLIGGP